MSVCEALVLALLMAFHVSNMAFDFRWAALLAVLIVVVNLVLPGHVSNFCQTTFGMEAGLSNTIASAVNTLLAVIVSFPVLKFWITPDTPSDGGGADTGGDGEA